MNRSHRRHIALFLSLLMTAFLACQGMAQAALVRTAMPAKQHQAATMGMSCHESLPADTAKSAPACPSDCQHLDKATESASATLAVLDHLVPIVAFMLPLARADVGAIQLTSLSFIPPDPDPPATLRFHRFRE
ncbi:MAG: hypothetical protein ACRERR_03690 [Moraxellaceae bacterium]